jgi:hypothetical protein
MRTFAQKPKAPQQTTPAKLTIPSRAHAGQSREVNLMLHLQRTVGNRAVQRTLQTHAEELEVGLGEVASSRFAHDSSRVRAHATSPARVQAKLTVCPAGDIYEQDADEVSKRVMRMPEPQPERACPCGGGCPKCPTEQSGPGHESLQTKRVQAGLGC